MLSIQKLSLQNIDYYLKLAREDYYLNGGEPRGTWHGKGCAAFGLQGIVEDENFRNLFDGFSPDGRTKLVKNAGQHDGHHTRCPGWDLTFSVPKSYSVVWSQAGKELRRRLQEINLEAVRVALSMMEDFAGITRRGKGGKIFEKASLVFGIFEHGTSRALEPQLHLHAILFNLAFRADGTTGALRSDDLYKFKMAVGALYRNELAARLARELHLSIEKVKTWFEISGVDQDLINEFSSRRNQIVKLCEARGFYDAKAAEKAALETREVKGEIAREKLFESWQEIGRQFGWGEKEVCALLNAPAKARDWSEEKNRVTLAATELLQQSDEKLTKEFVIQTFAQQAQDSGLDAAQVLKMAEDSFRQKAKSRKNEPAQNAKRQEETKSKKATGSRGSERAKGKSATREEKSGGENAKAERQDKNNAAEDTKKNSSNEHRALQTREPRFKRPTDKKDSSNYKQKLLGHEEQTTALQSEKSDEQQRARSGKRQSSQKTRGRNSHWERSDFDFADWPKAHGKRRAAYGPIKQKWDFRFFSIESRDKFLFHKAPRWNPVHDWTLPSLVLRPNGDPFSLNAKIGAEVEQLRREAWKLVDKIISGATGSNHSKSWQDRGDFSNRKGQEHQISSTELQNDHENENDHENSHSR